MRYVRRYAKKLTKKARKENKVATIKQVKRLINRNVDKQWIDEIVTGGNVTNTATLQAYSQYPQDNCIFNSIKMTCSFTNPTLNNTKVRFIVFQWKDVSAPTAAAIFAQPSDPLAQFTWNMCEGRLHVLTDQTFTMDVVNKPQHLFKKTYYSKALLPIKYDGINNVNNAIYYIVLSNQTVTPPLITDMNVQYLVHEN